MVVWDNYIGCMRQLYWLYETIILDVWDNYIGCMLQLYIGCIWQLYWLYETIILVVSELYWLYETIIYWLYETIILVVWDNYIGAQLPQERCSHESSYMKTITMDTWNNNNGSKKNIWRINPLSCSGWWIWPWLLVPSV